MRNIPKNLFDATGIRDTHIFNSPRNALALTFHAVLGPVLFGLLEKAIYKWNIGLTYFVIDAKTRRIRAYRRCHVIPDEPVGDGRRVDVVNPRVVRRRCRRPRISRARHLGRAPLMLLSGRRRLRGRTPRDLRQTRRDDRGYYHRTHKRNRGRHRRFF